MAIELRINQICYPTNYTMVTVNVDTTDRNDAEMAMRDWANGDPELDGLVELVLVEDGKVVDSWEYKYESYIHDPDWYRDE